VIDGDLSVWFYLCMGKIIITTTPKEHAAIKAAAQEGHRTINQQAKLAIMEHSDIKQRLTALMTGRGELRNPYRK